MESKVEKRVGLSFRVNMSGNAGKYKKTAQISAARVAVSGGNFCRSAQFASLQLQVIFLYFIPERTLADAQHFRCFFAVTV